VSYAEIYASPLQHPWLLWAAAISGLIIALSRRGLSRDALWFCVAIASLSVIDAWLTASEVLGIGSLGSAGSTWIPLLFVLLGDFRYFFFVETARQDGTLRVTKKAFWIACGWTLIVPVASFVVSRLAGWQEARMLFLVYEALFVVLLLGLSSVYLAGHAKALRWTRRVSVLVFVYYGSWAAADALILFASADEGFLLRIVPNVLYYGGFAPTVAWTAPARRSSASPQAMLRTSD
jgi:hypothetical protein